MPYSVPSPTVAPFPSPLPVHSQGRVGHRRSHSYITPEALPASGSGPHSFAATTTTGAFASLGVLPRRRTPSASPCSTTATAAGARTTSYPSTAATTTKSSGGSTPKKPTFHFRQDEDEDEEDSPDDVRIGDDDDAEVLRAKLKPGVSLAVSPSPSARPQIRVTTTMTTTPAPTANVNAGAVPFPRTSPTESPVLAKGPLPYSRSDDKLAKTNNSTIQPTRPYVSRTASSPILLSNGKPLKSSLKSSSSSPNIPFPSQSLVPSIMFPQLHPQHPYNHHHHHHHQHQRAASAPTTPRLSSSGASSPSPSTPGSPQPQSPTIQKNVHFPSQEEGGLATVRLFNRSAKPASLSRVGEDTETETDGEGYGSSNSAIWTGGFNRAWSSVGYSSARVSSSHPFPRFGGGKEKEKEEKNKDGEASIEVDQANSSPIPQRGAEHAAGNVFLEALGFESSTATQLTLSGSLLVRNITYQKTVAVRFTLDEWHTTHEVHAQHSKSLPCLPERFRILSRGGLAMDKQAQMPISIPIPTVCPPSLSSSPSSSSSSGGEAEVGGPTWDRFVFSVNMEDYKATLDKRTMWVVGRYVGGDGLGGEGPEWWDNNRGGNYRVRFRRVVGEVKEKVEVVPGLSVPVPATTQEKGREFRRNVVSAPPSFAPPKTTLSAPQLSSSLTFPGSSPHSSSYQTQSQTLKPVQQTQDQRQRQEALTQSTVARLKKLSLRNYAAPAAVPSRLSYSSPPHPEVPIQDGDVRSERRLSTCSSDAVSISTSTSASTSADSTPLQTPTQDEDEGPGPGYYPHAGKHHGDPAGHQHQHQHQHDVEVDVLNHSDEGEGVHSAIKPRWRMQFEDGHVATLFEVKPRRALGVGVGVGVEDEDTPTGSGVDTPVPVPVHVSAPVASASVQPTQDTPPNPNPNSSSNSNPIPTLPISILSPRRARSPSDEMTMAMALGGVEMGTSPPFSALAGMGLDSLVGVSLGMGGLPAANSTRTGGGGGMGNVHWSWGSSPCAGMGMGSMESVGLDGSVETEKTKLEPKLEEEKGEGEEEVAMDMDADTQVLLNDIKERSTAPPPPPAAAARRHIHHHHPSRGSPPEYSALGSTTTTTNGGLGHLPQRRRAGPAKGGLQPPTATIGSGSDSSSASSSASMPGAWKKPSTHQRHFPAHHAKKASLSSSPPLSQSQSQPQSQPQPKAQLSSTRVGGEESSDSEGDSTPATEESVVESRGSPPSQPQGAAKDKLYQAFVRQWCFAQGP